MKTNSRKFNNKGIAIILTLSLLAFLAVFGEITWSYYISNNQLQKRYQNDLKTLYDIEAAKAAVMWEEANADSPHTWETITNSTSKLGNSSISGGFYRLAGYNFRAQAAFSAGSLNIYIHAFTGTEANPQNSQYLEYLNVNSPLYQFAIFSNSNIDLPVSGYDALFHCNGGKIHTNGDVNFWGWWGYYARLDGLKQLTAAGNIQYSEGDHYPAPHLIDEIFDGTRDGMAPAPAVTGDWAAYPTTGEEQDPGPFREYYDAGYGATGIGWKWYGNWLGGEYIGQTPYLWQGEESYFYGGRLAGTPDQLYYLTSDGDISWDDSAENATIHRFYLSDQYGTSLSESAGKQQFEVYGAYLRPYQDNLGNPINDWFNIPTGLPQAYSWDKYSYLEENEQPVEFYVTERCAKTDEGAYQDDEDPEPGVGTTWRYRKVNNLGQPCTTDACYNNPTSTYVKAQNYTADGQPYFSNIDFDPYNSNMEFLSNYAYGEDANDPDNPYRQVYHFNSAEQPSGFQQYSALLASYGISDFIVPGVERKEMSLGNLFDTDTQDSAYKTKAEENGLYLDTSNISSVIANLNAGGVQVAKIITFFNWQTNLPVTVLDIDLGKMKEQEKAPANGIIYAKGVPLRFSNAEELPGTNSTDGKKAVFTVISEESVYLKGDYNTQDWKVSNIATQKMVYTLSNAFTDPSVAPDFAIYLNWPYVFVKLDGSGHFIPEEGTPGVDDGDWLEGGEQFIDEDLQQWVWATADAKQAAHESQAGLNPPNRVDKQEYIYNSLFLSSYPINDRLENWHFYDSEGYEQSASTVINGSVLDLYDDSRPEYENYAVWIGAEESAWDYNFDYRGREAPSYWVLTSYGSGWDPQPGRILAYDERFPQTIPNNFDATLGVTGVNVWRLVTQDYFNNHIQ